MEKGAKAYRAVLSVVSVNVSFIFCWVDLVELGVMPSFILVEKSLRPASDMVVVLNVEVGLVWFGWVEWILSLFVGFGLGFVV